MRSRCAGWALGFLLTVVLLSPGMVWFGCGGGGGGDGSTPLPPAAPSSVTANPGDNQATLSWSSVSGATSYNVYYRTAPGVTKATGTKVSGVQSPNVVSGLTNGTPYYFVVTAVNSGGESAESAERSATPTSTPPPPAPTGVRATAGDNTVTVSWDAAAGATSYNIYYRTAAGVTKTNGTPITGATSPRIVTGLTNGTTYYFVVTAANANGESTESSEVSATPVAPAATFSQADLTGNWDGIFFDTGSGSGWVRVVATINSSGGITVTSLLDSAGGTTPPPAGSITWTISAAGVVSESGPSGSASFYGQMSSNKLLVIGKEGAAGSSSATLRVFRKRTGTAFSSADLANKTFKFHGLRSGTDNAWSWGAGTTNASNVVTITEEWTPSGQQPPGSGGTLSVSSAGIVTDSTDSTSYGLMTDDKKVIFMINGGSNNYGLIVITITGQNYTQSDYEGIFNFFAIRNNVPNPGWSYGVASVDAAGNGTYLSYTDSGGGAAPGAFQRVLSAIGVVTDPADATAHGQMSYNKDITVRTNTNAAGRYGIVIGFK